MEKKSINAILSVVLYIVAGLLVIYSIWSYTFCAGIISEAKAAGQLAVSGNEYDIVSFYMGNCGQYFIFALLLASVGLLLQKKPQAAANTDTVDISDEDEDADSDEELDEWFEE